MTEHADQDPAELVESLRRKVDQYERWFRFLDSQNRVLEMERQKLSAVLNHTDAGFLVMEASQKVIWVNDVFSIRFGDASHRGQVLGATCSGVLCGREAACEACPVSKAFASGEVAHCEIQLQDEGRPRFIYATAMPIKSPYGDTEEALVMVQDVSNLEVLRRSQEAIEASEERLRLLVETVNVVPWEMDLATFRFTHVGLEAVPLFGYPIEDWYRDGFWAAYLHPDDRERALRACREATTRGGRGDFEFRMIAADGREIPLRSLVSVVTGAPGPSVLRGLMVDITHQKASEVAPPRSSALSTA